jgi:hypothetical protein
MNQPKMTLEDKTVNISSGHGQNRSSGPTPPKMRTFTGKEDWRPYFLQFCHIANKYEWSDQDRLDKLIECLRDRALKYFTTRPKFVQDNYKLTCKKIEERFGCKDLANVIRRQLQELRQVPEESHEEYAEHTQDLAADGFPGTSDEFIQIVASDAFLKGCQDKRVALTAMDKDPENLDKAVQLVKSAMTNQRVIFGIKKRVTFQETEMEDCDPDDDFQASASLRTVYRKDTDSTMSKFEARLKKMEEDLKETITNVQQILDILTRNNTVNRARSPQRQNSSKSPVRDGRCYNCDEEGHFSSSCTKPRRLRSPQWFGSRPWSPTPDSQSVNLSFQGLKT